MSIRRLKTLIAVAETGSFSDAADAVFLTPAAVGQQIKTLEQELGVKLFDRSKRSPQLNRLGHALVPKAREILHAYDNLAPALAGDVTGTQELNIGAVPTTMTGLVPQALKALRETHDNLHVRIIPGLSADLLPQVERGFLDAAITSEPAHTYDHLQFRAFALEPLIVLAPLDATEADPEVLLQNYPFIRFNRRAWVGQLIDEWLTARKLRVREIMELDTLESISTMVFHNLGVSIVPKRCVPSPRPLALKRVPLGDSAKPRVLGVLSRRDSPKYSLVEIFLAELVAVVAHAGEVDVIPVE